MSYVVVKSRRSLETPDRYYERHFHIECFVNWLRWLASEVAQRPDGRPHIVQFVNVEGIATTKEVVARLRKQAYYLYNKLLEDGSPKTYNRIVRVHEALIGVGVKGGLGNYGGRLKGRDKQAKFIEIVRRITGADR